MRSDVLRFHEGRFEPAIYHEGRVRVVAVFHEGRVVAAIYHKGRVRVVAALHHGRVRVAVFQEGRVISAAIFQYVVRYFRDLEWPVV